jgi:hypothetical protein
MTAKNHNITWLQSTNQTEIMPQYQSFDSRKRGKLRLERYANADPNLVALLGGDRFPEGPTRIIEGGQ